MPIFLHPANVQKRANESRRGPIKRRPNQTTLPRLYSRPLAAMSEAQAASRHKRTRSRSRNRATYGALKPGTVRMGTVTAYHTHLTAFCALCHRIRPMYENATERKPNPNRTGGINLSAAKLVAVHPGNPDAKKQATNPSNQTKATIANNAARRASEQSNAKGAAVTVKAEPKKRGTPRKSEKGARSAGMDKPRKRMPDFDTSTRDGRRSRLEWMAKHGIDTAARQAINDLERMDAEDMGSDPNAKVDPAEVCAYLARCNLYGDDPAELLLKNHGLKRVLKVLAHMMGFEHISAVYKGKTSDYTNKEQCLKGEATDCESVGVSVEGEPAPAGGAGGGEQTDQQSEDQERTDPPAQNHDTYSPQVP